MKTKIFPIILAAALFCLPSYAQLKVYQNGNVSVKSADSTSTVGLSIGSSTYPSPACTSTRLLSMVQRWTPRG